jgi:hypothetical protein
VRRAAVEQPAFASRSVLALPHGFWRQADSECALLGVTCKEASTPCAGTTCAPTPKDALYNVGEVKLHCSEHKQPLRLDTLPGGAVALDQMQAVLGGTSTVTKHSHCLQAPQPAGTESQPTPYSLRTASGLLSSLSHMEHALSRMSTGNLAPPSLSPAPSDSTIALMMSLAASSHIETSNIDVGGSSCYAAGGAATLAPWATPCSRGSERAVLAGHSALGNPPHPLQADSRPMTQHTSTSLRSGPDYSTSGAVATVSTGSRPPVAQPLPPATALRHGSTGGSTPGGMPAAIASRASHSFVHSGALGTAAILHQDCTTAALAGKPAGLGGCAVADNSGGVGSQRLSPSLYVKGLPPGASLAAFKWSSRSFGNGAILQVYASYFKDDL